MYNYLHSAKSYLHDAEALALWSNNKREFKIKNNVNTQIKTLFES